MPIQVRKRARAAGLQPARRRVVARLWRAAERQLAEIEARLVVGGDPLALERDARSFALITRTVRELVALDLEAQARKKQDCHAGKEEDVPHAAPARDEGFASRDIEAFRDELARRLARLREEGAAQDPA